MKKIIILLLLVFSLGSPIQTFADEKPSETKAARDKAKKEAKEAYEADCAASGECLEQPTWNLKVSDFVPGRTFTSGDGSDVKARADSLFTRIIKSLMIALGVLAVFIMTIGGGYMILHNGQDELLNKGKTIFMSGIYAVVIALVSYFLVDIIASILYTK